MFRLFRAPVLVEALGKKVQPHWQGQRHHSSGAAYEGVRFLHGRGSELAPGVVRVRAVTESIMRAAQAESCPAVALAFALR